MTEAQAIEAISEQWSTGWAAAQPTVPTTLDNETFDAVDVWARMTVAPTVRTQISMGPSGSRRFRHSGRIAVQLFGSVNVGAQQLATLADSVRLVLEGITIAVAPNDGVVTQAGSSQNKPTDGRWAMKLVLIPFYFDERR